MSASPNTKVYSRYSVNFANTKQYLKKLKVASTNNETTVCVLFSFCWQHLSQDHNTESISSLFCDHNSHQQAVSNFQMKTLKTIEHKRKWPQFTKKKIIHHIPPVWTETTSESEEPRTPRQAIRIYCFSRRLYTLPHRSRRSASVECSRSHSSWCRSGRLFIRLWWLVSLFFNLRYRLPLVGQEVQ